MRYLIALFIFSFFVPGVSFCYEQVTSQKKEVVEKSGPKVNFTWGKESSDDKPKNLKKEQQGRYRSLSASEKTQPKKTDIKPAKETPQWIKNIKSDFREIFLFEK